MKCLHRRYWIPLAAMTAVTALVAGCGSSGGSPAASGSATSGSSSSSGNSDSGSTDPGDADGSTGNAADDTTLTSEFTTDPSTFDPARAAAADDYLADALLYVTLLARDKGSTLVGNLASDWTAESASDYILTIRDDATCADGTPITASVVADSLKYLADDETGDHIAGPQVFGEGEPTIAADDDASTVTIKTAEPYTDLLTGLSAPQSGIVCPAGLKDTDDLAAGTVTGAFSGPYVLGKTKAGVSYTFDLRDDFDVWPDYDEPLTGHPAAHLKFGIRTDMATAANKALAGDLDLALIGGKALSRFDDGDYNEVTSVIANIAVIFNERDGHYFADKPDAREAVAHLIDREKFNQIFSNGVSPVFNTIVPKDFRCALDDPSLIPDHDPAAAGDTLKGATINIIASTAFGDNGKGADYIAEVLREAGADVSLNKTDNATWATATHSPDSEWDLTIQGDTNVSGVISASLQRVMGPALEDGGRSRTAADNPEGAKALEAGLAETDPDQQCADYATAQKTLFERVDAIPLDGIVWKVITPSNVTMRSPGGLPDYATTRIVG